MKYLVAVSIGPVQEYIAAARRCRDLWYGSQLLSEISKAAARRLQEWNADLIFPSPQNDADLREKSGFTVANKLLAVVESSQVEALLDEVRSATAARLHRAAILESMRMRGLSINVPVYWRQLQGMIEFYSAWTPLGEDYSVARNRVEELLAARKVLRDFQYFEGEAGKYKSSLDGARESVIEKRSNRLFESNLKDNEYLDAIGVVKRFGGGNPRFDSTVDVAAMPFVKGCQRGNENRKAAFQQYKMFLGKHNLSSETYSLLYEHESRQLFEENEAATRELKEFRAILGKPNPPYYALLLGDGDRMGEAISGLKTPEAHKEFSAALSGFAGAARTMIDTDYEGCSIYCGGDDVLALLPLHTALECAAAVNQLFRAQLLSKGYDVTFSAGIVVAHALDPLNEVREWAAGAERTAKSEGGRNAVCISVYPRSGSPIGLYGRWHEMVGAPSEKGPLLTRMVSLYAADQNGIPRGLGYELRDLVERLKGWTEMDALLPQLVLSVAEKKECSIEARELIKEYAVGRDSIERLYKSMMVARWFARAKREAKGDGTNDNN